MLVQFNFGQIVMAKVAQSLNEHCNSRIENSEALTFLPQYRSVWYFSRKELQINSPSGMDGIDWSTQNNLRLSYCSFIQKLGMQLRVPQLTIATAIMFCHRFYMRQSHAKNDWQTVATACMFLAAKVEETPCHLDQVVRLAYQLIYAKDIVSAQRIQSKDVFAKQKDLIWIAERLLLSTLAYDLNIQHPYKPLMAAMKKFNLPREVMKVAWNFVNDWLRTTLCLQYKPHYVAAGSLYLAARLHTAQLTSEKGPVWWQEFDVAPRVLEEAIREMMEMLGYKRVSTTAVPTKTDVALPGKEVTTSKEVATSSPESCIASQAGSPACSSPVLTEPKRAGQQSGGESTSGNEGSYVNNKAAHEKPGPKHDPNRNSESPHGVVVAGEDPQRDHGQSATGYSMNSQSIAFNSLDRERIREKLKRRRQEREKGLLVVRHDTSEDSLERELESAVEMGIEHAERHRKVPRI